MAVRRLQEEEQKEEKEYLLRLSSEMIKFKSLNQSEEFKKILKKKRLSTKYFIIYFDKNLSNVKKYLNISFVMKKSIGNAVIRNRVKRKLKSAVRNILRNKQLIDLNYTYVILGKNNVYKDKFSLILNEISSTFEKIKQKENYS